MLYQEKSGNPGFKAKVLSIPTAYDAGTLQTYFRIK
jgi:hypothetical protein